MESKSREHCENTATERTLHKFRVSSSSATDGDGSSTSGLLGSASILFPKRHHSFSPSCFYRKLRKHRRRSLSSWKSRNAVPTAPAIPNLRALCFFATRIIITRIPLTAAAKNRTSAPRRCLLISTGRCAEYLSEKGGKWSATAEPGWERESTIVVGEVGHPQRYWRGGRRKWEMGRKQMEEAERRGTTPFADTKRGKGGVGCGPAAAGDREPQNIPPLNSSPPASTLPLPSSSTKERVVDWRW